MRCARCGAELEPSTLHGLCPVCLFDSALPDVPDEGSGFRYDLIEEVARGGMGVVYRAVQHGSQRQVAVKMILAEQAATPGMMERFRSEAEAVASLDHPNILPIYETGESEGHPFYSMKFADGGTLRERASEFVEPRAAARLIATIARAVHHAHEHGILHRDLKPGNVLLDGAERRAFVSDFGLAKWMGRESRLTIAQSTLGTPHYIAPEQAAGSSTKLTRAADIYSLGAIFYELLAGRPPFVGDTALETLRLARETEAPAPRKFKPSVPRDLEVICLKCLAKEPAGRYASAVALAEDLERWLEGHTITARPANAAERAWRWAKRNRALAGLSAALALALGFVLLALLNQQASNKLAPRSRDDGQTLPEKSVAVLPFVDLSAAKDQEYFCDGISEQILDSLARVEGLQVAARTSSFSFKGTKLGAREIAAKLGVRHLLEGSLRREGNRIRVTAQLIDASNGFHIWSDTYERELQGVFTVQDEITKAITNSLKLKLVAARPAPAQNSEAYELYLQGVFFSNKSTEEGLRKSLEFFQRSLEKDPNSARTYAGIAKAWNWLADAYVRPMDAFPQMKAAASKAVELDEQLADGHIWLGNAKRILDWDVKGCWSEVDRALELDPNSAAALSIRTLGDLCMGNKQQALADIKASVRLDPLSPIVSNFAAVAYLCAGEVDEAIAEAKRLMQLDPNYIYESPVLGEAYCEKGMYTEAIAVFQRAQQITGAPQPGLAITYARLGREAEARQILEELKKVAATKYIAAEEIAAVHVALGEKDEAFKWLERGYADHGGAFHAIAIRPDFHALRSDPRFQDILRRIGLDPARVFVPAK